jgi:hypothetical protein
LLRTGHKAITQRLENTKTDVMEQVRRRSRSVSFRINENNHHETIAIIEEGKAVEKGLVDPLIDDSEGIIDLTNNDLHSDSNRDNEAPSRRSSGESAGNTNLTENNNNENGSHSNEQAGAENNSISEKKSGFWSYVSIRRFNFAFLWTMEKLRIVMVYYKEERRPSSSSSSHSRHSQSQLSNSFGGGFSPSQPAAIRQD